ncbi:hypothetical protein IW140_005952 [Coemansia sp. RSA 1813]|nr:hypothetical protein EV178_005975 [Coemansia sp. RSA 1646]KAJ1765738.1 hypothetical protein LPJ74_006228 [Coemansia sp. RSA 1843]KAJ2086102.1 hypothetical protein IW138_005922 [Coemansia sp. RSA 986]KAJ2211010.1 hypothetical protein EV179_005816 [Coemansia sp. RSA 487]KAJ2563864.1 hypothetical protein IW140_005952 [Coemansia sp. RSA 1813]
MRGFANLKHQAKLVAVGWLAASSVSAAAGQQHSFMKRLDTDAVQTMKGALLIKNGDVTTCELALISNKAAFVAANCLDYTDGTNTVDSSTVYQVMISDGNTKTIGRYDVDEVDAHPRYNPKTFANNVALLKYNSDSSVEWKNYIAANPTEWDSEFYVQRTLTTNSTSSNWNTPNVVQSSGSAPSGCAKASALYAANQVDFLCTTDTVSGSSSKKCVMPYGSVYGIQGPNLAVAALYSHSLIVGDSLCSNSAVFNYYTVLSNFLEWGGVMAKSTIYLFATDQSYINNNKANYTMTNPTGSASVSGVIVGGDLYAIPEESPSESSSSASSNSSEPTSSTEEPESSPSTSEDHESSSSDDASEASNGKSSSSHIATILIIVGVVLLVIGLIIFFLWRRNKKRKAARAAHEQYQANMYNNDFGAGDQADRMSSYSNPYDYDRAHLDNKIAY